MEKDGTWPRRGQTSRGIDEMDVKRIQGGGLLCAHPQNTSTKGQQKTVPA